MSIESRLHEVRNLSSIKELLTQSAEIFSDSPAYLVKNKRGGEYVPVTYIQLKKDVDALGTKLLEMGLQGEKIAILGNNCYQWIVAYLAVVGGVGVAVPLDRELKKGEIENLIDTAQCSCVFYTENYAKNLVDINVKHMISMNAYEVEEDFNRENHILNLVKQGSTLLENGDKAYLEKKIDLDEMALLLFTSGTTGTPKGVMLSNTNVCHVVRATSQIYMINPGEVTLSVLPIHHTFESVIGNLVTLFQGGTVAFYEGLKYVLKNMQEAKASFIVGVPLIIESLYNKIWKAAEKSGKDKMLQRAVKINKTLMAFRIDQRKNIFKSVRKNFGGNFSRVISGAAAINPTVLRGFIDLGFSVTQGYGLTETSPLVAGVPDFERLYNKAGSCGPAIPGVEIKIHNPDEDGIGEILIKGPNVMLGYYNMPEETAKVIKDGWFYSGDLGFLDKEGWLYITGRQKNVIVTKTGKNIYPEEIEALIKENKFVADSMVYGLKEEKGEEYYVAVQIQPDREALAEEKGVISQEETYNLFKEWIDTVNEKLAIYKRIKKVQIRTEDFVRTTTRKIKRQENI